MSQQSCAGGVAGFDGAGSPACAAVSAEGQWCPAGIAAGVVFAIAAAEACCIIAQAELAPANGPATTSSAYAATTPRVQRMRRRELRKYAITFKAYAFGWPLANMEVPRFGGL